jgi:ribulose-5-phosphate 4-epimerase/fuculose-1-phosphate aldolase
MAEEKYICFPEEEILKPREIIIELMEHMINRGLTDFSGGNMALRVGEKIYSTETHSADKYRWKLRPDNILVTDINKNILEGRKERLSREVDLHFGILQNFLEINCTIHGNTFYSPLIISLGIKTAGVTEVAQYYNIIEIPVVPESVEPLSDEENRIIISYFEELKKKGQALVAIMPLHGIVVGAKTHDEAFALFDAVEGNSKFILYRELLKTSVLVNKIFEKIGGKIDVTEKQKNNINQVASSIDSAQLKDETLKEENLVFELDASNKILTADEVIEVSKAGKYKTIKVGAKCIVTDFAEIRAEELGIKIIK